MWLQVPGDHKLAVLGTEQDAKQLLRQLSVLRPSPPHWRQLRPSLMVEAAHVASSADGKATLALQYAPCSPRLYCSNHVILSFRVCTNVEPALVVGKLLRHLPQKPTNLTTQSITCRHCV